MPGALIIRAAAQLGGAIPRFCDHPLLEALVFSLFPEPRRMEMALAAWSLYRRSGLRTLARASGVLRLFPRLRPGLHQLLALQARLGRHTGNHRRAHRSNGST